MIADETRRSPLGICPTVGIVTYEVSFATYEVSFVTYEVTCPVSTVYAIVKSINVTTTLLLLPIKNKVGVSSSSSSSFAAAPLRLQCCITVAAGFHHFCCVHNTDPETTTTSDGATPHHTPTRGTTFSPSPRCQAGPRSKYLFCPWIRRHAVAVWWFFLLPLFLVIDHDTTATINVVVSDFCAIFRLVDDDTRTHAAWY